MKDGTGCRPYSRCSRWFMCILKFPSVRNTQFLIFNSHLSGKGNASTTTNGGQAKLFARSDELVNQTHNDTGASGANGMSHSNATSIDVDDLEKNVDALTRVHAIGHYGYAFDFFSGRRRRRWSFLLSFFLPGRCWRPSILFRHAPTHLCNCMNDGNFGGDIRYGLSQAPSCKPGTGLQKFR